MTHYQPSNVSLAIWDHTVTQRYLLPDTSELSPVLTPAIQDGSRFTYPGGMEG